MEYITETYQLGLLDTIFSSVPLIGIVFALMLVATALLTGKKNQYYYKDTKGQLANHELNAKYHLNEKRSFIDYDDINRRIRNVNIIGAVLCGAVIVILGLLGFNETISCVAGLLVLLVATGLLIKREYARIGSEYENAK